ncbi:YrhK-like protein [Paramicrobacterium humi]|uniref:YrhK-like protein n=1 Tax=Paramicrobacterium humi TaxID=640635 RepID=A0A1H4N682_9MICO|nr:YrhK family protein [Microbacterium humi]SEB90799.1 YrhK-like protein [Microbacterium humi]
MALFDPRNRDLSPHAARVYAAFGLAHAVADFAAAGLFVVGSALFFSEQTKIPATWCFLIGSVFFVLKPTLRLARELKLAALDKVGTLASNAPEGPASVRVKKPDQADG